MSKNTRVFFRELDAFGDQVALIEGLRRVTYRDLGRTADKILESTAKTRKLVFLEARNNIDAVTSYIGCLRAGHVVYLFNEADEDRLAPLIENYNPNLIIRHPKTGSRIIERRHDDIINLEAGLMLLLSTSGSTGSPKFVKLSTSNIESNARSIVEYLGLTKADRAITTLKFNYSYGLSIIHSHLATGASIVLTDLSVTSRAFWKLFAENKATSFSGVPYTFELLGLSTTWASQPSLRYVTQAGGKLAPDVVSHIAALGRKNNWQYFTMYGQTEAAPRMAFLPSDLVEANPDCIGVAIPGGQLSVIDDEGNVVTAGVVGELIYSGPNVMMGYAQSIDDLATNDTPPYLRTGDIAVQTSEHLFRIIGRTSRFIKPFGVRIDLDDLQQQISISLPGAICTGNDDRLIIAFVGNPELIHSKVEWLKSAFGLPAHIICFLNLTDIPKLPNNKIDYQSLILMAADRNPPLSGGQTKNRPMVGHTKPETVLGIYSKIAGKRAITENSTFVGLAGDSLTYIVTSLALEEYLGFLPAEWETKTVRKLEALRNASSTEEHSMPLHFLNATRVLMLLIGIPFHAGMVFMVGASMILAAPERSWVATIVFSFTHSFRMFAFFLISGFFSMLMLRRAKVHVWLGHQIKRLAFPVFLGGAILCPLEIAAVALSPVRHGLPPLPFWIHQMTSLGDQWLAQRWFLVTLIGLVCGLGAIVAISRHLKLIPVLERSGSFADKHPEFVWWGTLFVLALAGPGIVVGAKLFDYNVYILGTVDCRTVFSFAPAFLAGATLCQRPKLLAWFVKPSLIYFGLAALSALLCVLLNDTQNNVLKVLRTVNELPCALLVTRVIISLMHRFANAPSGTVAKFTDASYVIYMCHILFVLIFNNILIGAGFAPLIVISVSSAASLLCCWGAYQVVKRSRFLSLAFNGGALNGAVGLKIRPVKTRKRIRNAEHNAFV